MKHFLLACLIALISPFLHAEDLYLRGQILHFLADPAESATSYQYLPDGLLVVNAGKITAVGEYNTLKKALPKTAKLTHYQNGLIMPGFIDTHLHYPQLDMIAANSGGHLEQWLEAYTFPFEQKFKNTAYAEEVSNAFLDEMLRNGTTTALVFTTIYPNAINSLFAAAEQRQMRLITGLVMGDRNLPKHLLQHPERAIADSTALLKKWHNKTGTRLLYALIFRFAPSTTPELFEKIEDLHANYPSTYVYTHISETKQETQWANELFNTKNYLDIYDRYHLLSANTLLAHGIYLSDQEQQRMHTTGTAVAFCPSSNLFLGSGLFDLKKAQKNKIKVGLGTDIGAGTSFSLLRTLGDAYKVLQLQNQNLSAFEGFYLATLGGARALNLEEKLGNFKPGKEADIVVLNLAGGTPLLKRRLSHANSLSDQLFVLMTLGDEHSILATYVNGRIFTQS